MPRGGIPALSSLLSSNAVPRACEAASVQVQIDHIASQISHLRSQLDGLEEQLRLHRAVLSPIRRVPAEVLGEIYGFVLPEDLLYEDERKQLVDLQLVCKAWRDAAQLKHRLWSGLCLSLFLLKRIPQEKIGRWLSRSGNIPKSLELYVAVHNDCESRDSPCRSHAPGLATLLVEGGPLGHLSLKCRRSRCIQNLLGSRELVDAPQHQRPWDSIKSVLLKVNDGWDESPDPTKSMFSRLPPNITSFELHLPDKEYAFTFESDSADTPLHIPPSLLERLTSFVLVSNWEGFKWLESTLPFCTNVETLTLNFNGPCWVYDSTEDQVQQRLRSGFLLPRVRTLLLKNAHQLDILSFLRTPQLADLDIDLRNDGEDMDCELTELVLEYIERSNCLASLRCFRLRRVQLDAEQLADTLRGLPSLTHLTLESVVVVQHAYRDTFDLLKKDTPPSLPHLEVLELLKFDARFSTFSLFKFLESRRPFTMENGKPLFKGPPDTLKKLTVTFKPTLISKRRQYIDTTRVLQVLKKWCGVSIHVGPIIQAYL